MARLEDRENILVLGAEFFGSKNVHFHA